MSLSWEPVKRGRTYCSPGCGWGCTTVEYNHAKRAGEKLAKRMGKGWTVRVHENMGWHYTAISPCDRFSVTEYVWSSGPTTYTAFLGDKGSPCAGRYTAQAKSPKAALAEVVRVAVEDLAKFGAVLTGL